MPLEVSMTKEFAGGLLVLVCCLVSAAIVPHAAAPPGDTYAAIRANDLPRVKTLVATAGAVNTPGEFGSTPLMQAAIAGSPEAMTLLIDAGADVNAQNAFGTTALMMSVADIDKVRLLLARGANVKAASKQGRTALFVAAMGDSSSEVVDLLITKGADVRTKDVFGNSLLVAATAGNDLVTIRRMLDAGLDVNSADLVGSTPILASVYHGNLEAVKLLLAKGASAKPVALMPGLFDGGHPKSGPLALASVALLHPAATSGSADMVRTLVEAGADVNARDGRSMTPLMLAVARADQDAAVIRLLLDHGADVSLVSAAGENAADWARKLGTPVALKLLNVTAMPPSQPEAGATATIDPKTAADRGLALLETSSQKFYEVSGCVSCHHQNATGLAAGEARSRGLHVDAKASAARVGMLADGPPMPLLLERMDIGVPEILASALTARAAENVPADPMSDMIVANLAASQAADGSWHLFGGIGNRPPTSEGNITRVALCIRALKAYASPGRAREMAARVAKARGWLASARAVTAEDRNMQLLGLYWAGADPASLKAMTDAILAQQLPNGSWRVHDGVAADAYATGQSLYVLAKAGGVATGSAAYQRGVHYLLGTQNANGSWRVSSRAPKFQAYFNSGFPYGGDQWISAWATGWATMALAQTVNP
jgi:ankyrin repeat protein